MELLRTFSDKEKLVGSKNYISWSFQLKTMLRSAEVWDEVISVPRSATPLTDSELKKKKNKAIAIFQATVKDIILPTVRRYDDDPATLWVQLKQRYESQAVQRSLLLKKKLSNIKKLGFMSIEEYLHEVEEFFLELINIDQPVDDEEVSFTILNGLPEDWGPFFRREYYRCEGEADRRRSGE